MNIQQQEKQLYKCERILTMIQRNKNYLQSKVLDSTNENLLYIHGASYFEKIITFRSAVHKRLLKYYAKELAKLSSPEWEEAMKVAR